MQYIGQNVYHVSLYLRLSLFLFLPLPLSLHFSECVYESVSVGVWVWVCEYEWVLEGQGNRQRKECIKNKWEIVKVMEFQNEGKKQTKNKRGI